MLARVIVAIVLLLLPTAVLAQVEKRLALLIGNQGYAAKVGLLKNPHNDVSLIETSLKQLGFKVTVLRDANYKAMDISLKRRAGPNALSFFYYSGHGVANPETQINYLIPVATLRAPARGPIPARPASDRGRGAADHDANICRLSLCTVPTPMLQEAGARA